MSSDADEAGVSNPSSTVIEAALRKAVDRCYDEEDMEELTLKRIRAAVETKLSLPDGYFKSHAHWGEVSKRIVTEQVDKHDRNSDVEPSTPIDKSNTKSERGKKNKVSGPATGGPQALSKSKGRTKNKSPSPSPDASLSSEVEANPANSAQQSRNEAGASQDDSDSDSIILDPTPPPKKKRKIQTSSDAPVSTLKAKPAKPTKSVKPSKVPTELSQEDEKIKRLQSQLVKCGIRKIWGRELAPYDSPRAKIKHLESMLRDAGMDGRFSDEKARAIKERRELNADIEAIQEGEKKWGKTDEEESGPGRRRLAKGLAEIQEFADEESD